MEKKHGQNMEKPTKSLGQSSGTVVQKSQKKPKSA